MAISIPTVRKNAPYVYLVDGDGDKEYFLYIYMLLSGKTKARRTSADGSAYITIKVEDDNTAPNQNTPYYDKYPVTQPEASLLKAKLQAFGIEEEATPLTIEVLQESTNIDGDTKSSYKVSVAFSHSDNAGATNGKIVFNAPYLYLTNPNAEIGSSDDTDVEFVPRCHIPLEGGYDLQTPALDAVATVVNGCYTETIQLNNIGSNNLEVSALNLNSNLATYQDANRKAGHYEVVVEFPAPMAAMAMAAAPPRRKGRLRNRSSDTNPNGFID